MAFNRVGWLVGFFSRIVSWGSDLRVQACDIRLSRMILPRMIRKTIGVIAVGTRRYLDWLQVLYRYVAFCLWTVAVFASYNPLVNSRQDPNASKSSVDIIDLGQKLFFAFLLCSVLLLFEKFSIQWIAGQCSKRHVSVLYLPAVHRQIP